MVLQPYDKRDAHFRLHELGRRLRPGIRLRRLRDVGRNRASRLIELSERDIRRDVEHIDIERRCRNRGNRKQWLARHRHG